MGCAIILCRRHLRQLSLAVHLGERHCVVRFVHLGHDFEDPVMRLEVALQAAPADTSSWLASLERICGRVSLAPCRHPLRSSVARDIAFPDDMYIVSPGPASPLITQATQCCPFIGGGGSRALCRGRIRDSAASVPLRTAAGSHWCWGASGFSSLRSLKEGHRNLVRPQGESGGVMRPETAGV